MRSKPRSTRRRARMRAGIRICRRTMSMGPKPSPPGRGLGEGESGWASDPHPGPLPNGEGVGDRSLPKLLTWLSPAFPVGSFAYSHGLEWAVEAGDVRDEATLRD